MARTHGGAEQVETDESDAEMSTLHMRIDTSASYPLLRPVLLMARCTRRRYTGPRSLTPPQPPPGIETAGQGATTVTGLEALKDAIADDLADAIFSDLAGDSEGLRSVPSLEPTEAERKGRR
jgi:hypothetical protein